MGELYMKTVLSYQSSPAAVVLHDFVKLCFIYYFCRKKYELIWIELNWIELNWIELSWIVTYSSGQAKHLDHIAWFFLIPRATPGTSACILYCYKINIWCKNISTGAGRGGRGDEGWWKGSKILRKIWRGWGECAWYLRIKR